jgi:hypothetical protein
MLEESGWLHLTAMTTLKPGICSISTLWAESYFRQPVMLNQVLRHVLKVFYGGMPLLSQPFMLCMQQTLNLTP